MDDVERLARKLQSRGGTATLKWDDLNETRHEHYRMKARNAMRQEEGRKMTMIGYQVWLIDHTDHEGEPVRLAFPLTNPLPEDEAGELFDELNAASLDLPFDLEMRQVL